ncbi:uncharacterized protein [Drosophila virilis]|nr:uncharacterized protein LOC116651609 [Drosophila virilis]
MDDCEIIGIILEFIGEVLFGCKLKMNPNPI